MAHPYRWVDEIVTSGWLAVLSGPAVKLLWAAGKFYDRGVRNAKADAVTLQRLAGLGRSTFYAALAEVNAANLIEIEDGVRMGKYREYPVHIYRLMQPMPAVPPGHRPRRRKKHTSANADTYSSSMRPYMRKKSSARADRTVHQDGRRDGQNPHHERIPAPQPPTDSTQLGSKGIQEAEKIVRQCPVLAQHFGRVHEGVVEEVLASAGVIATTPDRLSEEVHALSRTLQASGVPVPEVKVREALEDVVAVLDPTVQAAVRAFNGEIVAVRKVTNEAKVE